MTHSTELEIGGKSYTVSLTQQPQHKYLWIVKVRSGKTFLGWRHVDIEVVSKEHIVPRISAIVESLIDDYDESEKEVLKEAIDEIVEKYDGVDRKG